MADWVACEGAQLDGRYELEAQIGEGGMGQVWRARHVALERKVAIKFLSGSLTEHEETRKRFLVEAKVTAQLRTRHAVQVFDCGLTEDGQPYLVMELLHGETLAQRIERLGQLPLAMTVTILQQAAKALSRAHDIKIVHRDFKPDNVFLTKNEDQEDEVKVVDFGIAKLIGNLTNLTAYPPSMASDPSRGLSRLTATGRQLGTPHYMSPEQIQMSSEIGAAADVWALGVVAYECLTGQMPFEGGDVMAVFARAQVGNFRSARELNPEVPSAFDEWFTIACSLDPQDRFSGDAQQAATFLAEALRTDGESPVLEVPSLSIPFEQADTVGSVAPTSLKPATPPPPVFTDPAGSLARWQPRRLRAPILGAVLFAEVLLAATLIVRWLPAHSAVTPLDQTSTNTSASGSVATPSFDRPELIVIPAPPEVRTPPSMPSAPPAGSGGPITLGPSLTAAQVATFLSGVPTSQPKVAASAAHSPPLAAAPPTQAPPATHLRPPEAPAAAPAAPAGSGSSPKSVHEIEEFLQNFDRAPSR